MHNIILLAVSGESKLSLFAVVLLVLIAAAGAAYRTFTKAKEIKVDKSSLETVLNSLYQNEDIMNLFENIYDYDDFVNSENVEEFIGKIKSKMERELYTYISKHAPSFIPEELLELLTINNFVYFTEMLLERFGYNREAIEKRFNDYVVGILIDEDEDELLELEDNYEDIDEYVEEAEEEAPSVEEDKVEAAPAEDVEMVAVVGDTVIPEHVTTTTDATEETVVKIENDTVTETPSITVENHIVVESDEEAIEALTGLAVPVEEETIGETVSEEIECNIQNDSEDFERYSYPGVSETEHPVEDTETVMTVDTVDGYHADVQLVESPSWNTVQSDNVIEEEPFDYDRDHVKEEELIEDQREM